MSKKQPHFGKTMASAMVSQELIAADVARLTAKHPQYISDILRKQSVTTTTESLIARALGLTMAEFWEFQE